MNDYIRTMPEGVTIVGFADILAVVIVGKDRTDTGKYWLHRKRLEMVPKKPNTI